MLTEDEVAVLRERHQECGRLGCSFCYETSSEWPCETTRLLDEIDRLRGYLQTVFADPYHTPQDASEQCLFCGGLRCEEDCSGLPLIQEFGPKQPAPTLAV